MSKSPQTNVQQGIPADAISQLGHVSDRELSKRFGISTYYIKQARLAQGVEAYTHGYDLPPEVVSKLGTVPDRHLTARYAVPGPVLYRARVLRSIPRFKKGLNTRIARKREKGSLQDLILPKTPVIDYGREWTAEEDALFECFAIVEIAARLRISKAKVHKRARLIQWSPAEDTVLGTMADSMAAHLLSRPFWDVYHRRKHLQIAPYEYAYA